MRPCVPFTTRLPVPLNPEHLHHCTAENGQRGSRRYRDSDSRSNAASTAASEVEDAAHAPIVGKDKVPSVDGAEEDTVKLRNNDTGENFDLAEIEKRVPPSLDPGEVFKSSRGSVEGKKQ